MTTPRKSKQKPSADDIAKLADQGKNVSMHFTDNGKMMPKASNGRMADGLLTGLKQAVQMEAGKISGRTQRVKLAKPRRKG
jgi:hypothetical protein